MKIIRNATLTIVRKQAIKKAIKESPKTKGVKLK